MATAAKQRTLKPEGLIFAAGGILVCASLLLKKEAIFTPAVFVCMFAGLSALFAKILSPRPFAVQATAIAVGLIGVVVGIYWFVNHKNDPYIVSPIVFGYLGGGMVISGIINLMYQRGRTQI